MKSIGARLARPVHRAFRRSGPVLADRYHRHVLRTPREVRNAIAYVLCNARKHAQRAGRALQASLGRVDPASSGRWFTGWRGRLPRAADRRPWHDLVRGSSEPGGFAMAGCPSPRCRGRAHVDGPEACGLPGTCAPLPPTQRGPRRVRTGLQEHRRCAPEGSRLHHGARLHRADLVAPLPQVPGCARAGQGRRGGTEGQEGCLHPREALPLGRMGGAQGQGWEDRPQQGEDRRRPARLREPEALPVPARLQAEGQLDPEKLTPLLRLRYRDSIADAIADLGRPEEIGRVFAGFQRFLYERAA